MCSTLDKILPFRFLVPEDSFENLSVSFGMGMKTVKNILKETLPSIWNGLKSEFVKIPETCND